MVRIKCEAIWERAPIPAMICGGDMQLIMMAGCGELGLLLFKCETCGSLRSETRTSDEGLDGDMPNPSE